jgi:hypothetical protein
MISCSKAGRLAAAPLQAVRFPQQAIMRRAPLWISRKTAYTPSQNNVSFENYDDQLFGHLFTL